MEKYGTIPKKFTKAWWEYFWEYYKWHTIVTLSVIVMISSFVYSNVTRTKYDMYMSYVGTAPFFDVSREYFEELFVPVTEEITENEKIDISFDTYSFDASEEPDPANAEMVSAMNMKFMAELEAGDCYLYFITTGNLESYYGLTDGMADASLYAGENAEFFTDANGRACAVSLNGNEKLTKAGVDCSDLYLAVRSIYERDKNNETKTKIYENSLKIAEFIVGE